jgi:hypothetical protein
VNYHSYFDRRTGFDAAASFIFNQGSDLCSTSLLSLRRVDIAGIEQRLAELNWAWAPVMLSALCVQTLPLAYRSREISAVCNAHLNFTAAIRYRFIGIFFSQVLPSTVGGGRRPHLPLSPHRRRMADGQLFGSDRSRRWRYRIGSPGRGLPSVDARTGA